MARLPPRLAEPSRDRVAEMAGRGAADEVVVHYVWPNAKGDRYRTYEITFFATGAMVQKNLDTSYEREVRRVVCPD